MKKLLVATFLLIVLSPVRAQDKIVLINGDTIVSKVVRITGASLIVDNNGIEQELNVKFVTNVFTEKGVKLPISGPEKKLFWDLDDVNTTDVMYSEALEREADLYFSADQKVEVNNPRKKSNFADRETETKRRIIMYAANAYLVLQKEETMLLYFKSAKNFNDLDSNYFEYERGWACAPIIWESELENQKKHGLFFRDEKLYNNLGRAFETSRKDGSFMVVNQRKNGKETVRLYYFVMINGQGLRISRFEGDIVETSRYIKVDKQAFDAMLVKR